MLDLEAQLPTRVLLLEDSDIDADMITRLLARSSRKVTVQRASIRGEFEQALAAQEFELVLADYSLPDFKDFEALETTRRLAPDTPFIFISGVIGEQLATEAVLAGATDYVTKRDLARLPFLVSRAIDEAQAKRERRRATSALKESEERFRIMADSAPALIWAVDAAGRFSFANRRFETDFGALPDDLLRQGWARIVVPEDLAAFEAELAGAFAARRPFRAEVRVRDRTGAVRWLRCEGDVRWAGDEFVGYTGCAVDITDIRFATDMLEAEVENRTYQLAEKEEALRQAQKMEAIGQLTGGIAHDFNNMLAGILGAAELVKKHLAEGRTGDIDRYVEAILSSGNRAAALTHRLLAFSRRQTLHVHAADVNALVSSLDDLLQRTLGDDVELSLDLQPDLWPARTDVNQLESAVINLAINARDAMPDGGRLLIQTRNVGIAQGAADDALAHGDYVVLRVIDTGTGMSPDVLAKAFDPFFTTKPIGQGTGLGLSTIFGFAKQIGGHVRIDSKPGLGTTVELYMPREDAAPEQADTPEQRKAEAGVPDSTILVVEDEAIVQMLIVDYLNELGYRTLEAQDAKTALPIIESDKPLALMISDVGLPGMNGRQLADLARQHRPGLKVLFATGYAEAATSRSGFLGPGMDMISKPFDMETLALKVRQMIEMD